MNAYVRPLMGRYVDALRAGLDALDLEAPLSIMQSSGGVMTALDAAAPPGARARVRAGGWRRRRAVGLSQRLGIQNAIAFDMGGTTAKASLIEAGRVSRSREYEVGAVTLRGQPAPARIRRADPYPDDRHRRGRCGRRHASRGWTEQPRCTSARAARAPIRDPPATAAAARSRP